MLEYQTHMGTSPTVETDENPVIKWLGRNCKQHIRLKPDAEQAFNIIYSKCGERAEHSINEDNAVLSNHILTVDICQQSIGENKSRDALEYFSSLTSQCWESHQKKKSFLAYNFPSDKRSSKPDEEVVKLLQLLAGDVETNPGPKVSQNVLIGFTNITNI